MHNGNKVLMGTTGSNEKEVTNVKSSVTSFSAGVAVRLKNDGTLSKTLADGALLGVSLGRSLSDTDRVAVCRKGLRVPLAITASFEPVIGAIVYIDDATGLGAVSSGSATAVNAVYAPPPVLSTSLARVGGSAATAGIAEGATADTGTVGVAFIDMPGGL